MAQATQEDETIPVDKLGLINYKRIPWTKIRWDLVGARKSFDEKTKAWIVRMRFKILYELRYKYNCVPIMGSEWRVRDETKVPALKKAAANWIAAYKKRNITVRMGIEPYATSEAGYVLDESFEMTNIINSLNSMETTLQNGLDDRQIYKDTLRARQREIEIIGITLKGDFDKSNARFNEAMDLLAICSDKASQCESISVLRGPK